MLIGALFAGQHTSSITSTWTTLMLLHNPDIMGRVMDEIVTTTGTTDPSRMDVMTMNNIQQLDLLYNCVKESLRQYPPLIMLMRKAHVDVVVGDHTIPKGHYVFSSPPVTMNLPDGDKANVFTNPTKWDPDRFGKGREEDKQKKFSFCAFGGGKHGCLGEQFGYIQVKAIVTIMLRRYELRAVGPLPKPNYEAMVVGPLQTNNSCIVEYKRRKTPLPAPAGFVEGVSSVAAPAAAAAAAST